MIAVLLQTRGGAEFVRQIVLTKAVCVATAGALFGQGMAGRRVLCTRNGRNGEYGKRQAKMTYHDVSSLKIGDKHARCR
jgi:hypothetical protein